VDVGSVAGVSGLHSAFLLQGVSIVPRLMKARIVKLADTAGNGSANARC
jgi:hypothetical protein